MVMCDLAKSVSLIFSHFEKNLKYVVHNYMPSLPVRGLTNVT